MFLAVLLAGCAELNDLRQIKAMQDARIRELEKQNNEYKDAYYALKTEREEARIRYEAEIKDFKKQIADLENTRSEREERLGEDNVSMRRQLQSLTTQLNLAKANLQKQKDEFSSRITALESSVKQKESARKKAQENAEALTSQIASLQRKISSLEKQLAQKTASISALRSSVSDLEARLKKPLSDSEEYKKLKAELEKCKKALKKKIPATVKTDTVLNEAEAKFKKALAHEISTKNVQILRNKRGLVIRLLSDELFESGSVIVSSNARPLLAKIANLLSEYPDRQVYVEGHTDNTPIKDLPFLDNLALSSARADNVVRFLAEGGGIEKKRLKSIACSWFHPAATNRTYEGRRQNRRVDIVLATK